MFSDYNRDIQNVSGEKENFKIDSNKARQTSFEGKTLMPEAILKLNHDKKVRFHEQLAFKLEEMPLF